MIPVKVLAVRYLARRCAVSWARRKGIRLWGC